jgi:hypothetical protein
MNAFRFTVLASLAAASSVVMCAWTLAKSWVCWPPMLKVNPARAW